MNEYAGHKDRPEKLQAFQSAVDALSKTHLGHCSPQRVIELIEGLFAADEDLNRPHTLLIHQRAQLLFGLIDAYAKVGRVTDCWRALAELACLKPYSSEIPPLMDAVAKAVRKEKKSRLVLLISCIPRIHIALATKERLMKLLGDEFRVLVVVGQRNQSMNDSVLKEDLLVVKANDNYESLPAKINETFQYVYRQFGEGTCCFKVDEDLPVENGEILRELMLKLTQSKIDYAGFAGNNKENCERTWHFGKCEDPIINRKPHTKRFPEVYAYGPFYYLSSNAIAAFAKESIRFPDEILGHLYEDWYVGQTLRYAGVQFSAFSAVEWRMALGDQWWTVNRRWEGKDFQLLKEENVA